ncbi:hypothetical protein ACF0H5_005801 [Mactra antiquata]
MVDESLPQPKKEEFRRLYTQLETLKHRNIELGSLHIEHKLSALTEATQNDNSPNDSKSSTSNMNGESDNKLR